MRTPFYDTPEKIAALSAESRAWVGTPFMENSAAKGCGVSCHFLAAAIYQATGALPADFQPPRGTARRLRGGPALAMVDYVDQTLAASFVPVDGGDLQPGDLIVIAEDGRAKHVGVVLPDRQFLHVLRHLGVRISQLDDATYSEVVAIRRPVV